MANRFMTHEELNESAKAQAEVIMLQIDIMKEQALHDGTDVNSEENRDSVAYMVSISPFFLGKRKEI